MVEQVAAVGMRFAAASSGRLRKAARISPGFGNPALTGLCKVCPLLGHDPEGADEVDNRSHF